MIRDRVLQGAFFPVWAWLVPLVAIVLLYEALHQGPGDQSGKIVSFSIFIAVGAAALTRVCRIQQRFDPFEPLLITCVLFLCFYPLRALFAVWLDESWFEPGTFSSWVALSASALGFVSFAIGYKMAQRKSYGLARIWLDRDWNFKRARVVSLVFLLLGFIGFLMMRFIGGSLFYFITLDPDVKSPGSMKPWFFYVLWLCLLIQVGALIQLGAWLCSGRRTLWTFLYCVLALLSTFLLARLFTIFFAMLLAVCWYYKKGGVKVTQVALISLFLISYLGVAGLYREWISPNYNLEQAGRLAELAGQQKELALRYVVSNLEELSNLTELVTMTPAELPYQFGSTFTPVFLKPVPRVLMPTKPLGASALFTQQLSPVAYDDGFVTTLGAWGEWYLNFSWVGLVFGMALTGALGAVAYKAMRAKNELGRMLLYSSFLVVLLSWLRSDFNSATTYGLYYFIPAVLALAYITSAKPRIRQAAHR